MTTTIKAGQRLPAFRLATMGGTSRSIEDFLGHPTIYVGWASWHPSREGLPALQKFQAAFRDRLQVVAIAYDVQGPDLPMRYLKAAGYTFTPLIDSTCELSRRWGVTDLTFAVLVDHDGTIQVVGGAGLSGKPSKARAAKDGFVKSEFLLQSCTNLLGRGRKDEAVAALKEAAALDPGNRMIAPQILAITKPERFYH